MSEYHSDLEAIKRVMEEPEVCAKCGCETGGEVAWVNKQEWCHPCADKEPESAEVQIERKVDWLVRELDELCAMANNPETRDLVAKEAIGIGQIQFRAGLILSFLNVDKPQLKVVHRG